MRALLFMFSWSAASSTVAQIASPSGSGIDVWVPLLNAGTIGIVLVLLLMGKLVIGKTHDAVVSERDEMREELRNRNREDREQVIPTMVRNTEALARVAGILADNERGRA